MQAASASAPREAPQDQGKVGSRTGAAAAERWVRAGAEPARPGSGAGPPLRSAVGGWRDEERGPAELGPGDSRLLTNSRAPTSGQRNAHWKSDKVDSALFPGGPEEGSTAAGGSSRVAGRFGKEDVRSQACAQALALPPSYVPRKPHPRPYRHRFIFILRMRACSLHRCLASCGS